MAKLNAENIVGSIIKNIQNDEITTNIDADLLVAFKNHPFKIYNDQKMQEMIESIKSNGIVNPLIVREQGYHQYEIISGHNRWEASKQIGLKTLPVIIKNVDDDTARIMMVDTNLNQRNEILPSEKAFAYKIKLESLIRQEENGGHRVPHEKTRDILAESTKESGRQIQRYIRLTELITPLLDKVDNNELGFIPAVDISYLRTEEQEYVQEIMELTKVKPTKVQADMLKKKSQESGLTKKDINAILVEEKKAKLSAISPTKIRSYFPKEIAKDLTDDRMNEIMQEAIQDWLNKQK